MKKEECECSCNNSCGITSFVLGIVGSVFGVFVFPIILSILGLIFGIVQARKSSNRWAVWGIVLSIIGIIISVCVVWQIVSFINSAQQLIATCQANPSLPQCTQIAQMLGGQ